MTAARCDLGTVADAVAWVGKVVPTRPAHPVLAGMKFTADSAGTLTVEAFNYQNSHTAVLEADVAEPGSVLVSGHAATHMIGAMRGPVLELGTDGAETTLNISAGRSSYKLRTLALGEYPALPDPPPVVGFIESAALQRLSTATGWASARDNVVAILQGVHLTGGLDWLVAETTDRYAMSLARMGWEHKVDLDMVVPAADLYQAVSGLSGRVEVGASESQLRLTSPDRAVTLRALDADFPKVSNLIPPVDKWTSKVTVDRRDLIEALKRSRLAADFRQSVWTEGKAGDTEIVLHVGADATTGDEYLDAQVTDDFELWFNPDYMLAALTVIDADQVDIGVAGGMKPFAVHPEGDLDPRVRGVIMPRRPPAGAQGAA